MGSQEEGLLLHKNLVDVLKSKCSNDKGITFINGENSENFVSYQSLYNNALLTLRGLQEKGLKPEDELIFQVEDNEMFINLFWACLMGGIVPVSVNVGKNDEHRLKVFNIWKILNRPHLITQNEIFSDIEKFSDKNNLKDTFEEIKNNCIFTGEVMNITQNGEIYNSDPGKTAFIQFSSGSTGDPKGVILTHENLISNINAIVKASESTCKDSAISWMPLTHDMGLIGFHLSPIGAGINQYLMPTSLFVKRPVLWIKKVHEYRITLLSSPNFGYKFFLNFFKEDMAEGLDLSQVRLIFNGAEPISANICNEFLGAMSKYGLKKNTTFPVYGLAEASLAVTFPPADEELVEIKLDRKSVSIGSEVRDAESDQDSVTLIDLGYPVKDCNILVCDKNNHALEENVVGFVLIKGKNVTSGYYNREDINIRLKNSAGWLNTGDVGFIRKGRLILTGRAKDIIFINGQNIYPHDIENTVEEIYTGIGQVAACSHYNTTSDRQEINLYVYYKKSVKEFIPLMNDIKRHVFEKMGITLKHIIPVKKLPKTTSGKIQRYKLQEMYEDGVFSDTVDKISEIISIDLIKHTDIPENEVEENLLEICRKVFSKSVIGVDDNFIELGANSLLLTQAHEQIEEIYPGKVKNIDLFNYPTVSRLAKFIIGQHTHKDISADKHMDEDIAIIGMSVNMPMAENCDQFWNNIKNGVDCLREFPDGRRKDINEYFSFTNQFEKCDRYLKGSYLNEIDKFDYSFFHLSPKEAGLMNPAQRLFLTAAFEAIEDAGYGGKLLSGSNTGVYLGFISDSEGYKYGQMIAAMEDPSVKELSMTGNLSAIIPSRISYLLDLNGPSMLIDTACSSSLTAVHLACQALKSGDCNLAIAGGIKINLMPVSGEMNIGIESSDGVTRAFDDSSDGTGIGEGVGAVVLKPLSKAERDGDNIYAVIKSSACNQDGNSMGITAPNSDAQAEVIMKAWRQAGINPETISYIEAHGTGTKLGDPIEICGIEKAFGSYTSKKQFCAIGSVKTNIGHLYESSGIAGLIKTVLALRHKQLPPSLHFERQNRKIAFEDSPVYYNDRLRPWEVSGAPRRCGVSSFGFSGTNCHVVLEEYLDNSCKVPDETSEDKLVTLSAIGPNALEELVESYIKFLENEPDADMRDIAYTSNIGRGHYNHRLAIIFKDRSDIVQKLKKLNYSGLMTDAVNSIFYGEVKLRAGSKTGAGETEKTQVSLLAGEKIKEFIKKNKDAAVLKDICELYIKGAELKWQDLYRGENPRRVSLPLYAFDKKRCWLQAVQSRKNSYGFDSMNLIGNKAIPKELAEEISYTVEKWKKQIDALQADEKDREVKVVLLGKTGQEFTGIEEQLAVIWNEYLGFNEIDVNRSFYEMGGDSISMVKIVNKIHEKLKLELSYSEFISGDSIHGISEILAGKEESVESAVYPAITPDLENLHSPFPMTDVQLAYLMGREENIEMGGVSTHIYVELETELDIPRLSAAFKKVIGRHPMLRAVFLPDAQIKILEEVPEYKIIIDDISDLKGSKREGAILKERDRMSHYVFNPQLWPLFELKALKLSDRKSYLLVGIDMLIADGSSIQLICKELIDFYVNMELEMENIDFSFRDYMLEYMKLKGGEVYNSDRNYWLDKLESFPAAPALPMKCDPADVKKPCFKRLNKVFEQSDWNNIRKTAGANNISASALLCTAYADVLAYWSNQPALAINLTVFNRYPIHKDIHKLIGDFTSIMLLGLDVEPYESFIERAGYVQKTMIEALEHRHYDGVEFIREIARNSNMGTKPVMPVVFTSMLNNSVDAKDAWSNIGTLKMGISQTPQVYIDHQAVETGGTLNVTWDYVEDLFEQDVIEAMFEQYISILLNLADNNIENSIGPGKSDRQAISDYNNTEEAIVPDTLHRLIVEQVSRTPSNTAVIFNEDEITYKELHRKSNRIARRLTEQGVGRNDFIGVQTYRCVDTIVNLVGILKSGAAYVPIDPMYPEERKNYIAENSSCKMIIGPDFYEMNGIDKYSDEDVENINSTEDTAYVIYTSGSTGRPKGVIISHGAVTNTIIDINRKLNVTAEDRIIGISSMCFDLSVYDIFGALCSGAALVMVADQRDTFELRDKLLKNRITIWNSVPAIMDILVDSAEAEYESDTLRAVLLSGDWIPLKLPEKIKMHFEKAEVISLGGATEASIWSIYYPVKEVRPEWKSIPYGIPLANQKFYVLNYRKQPCAVGVKGELYIGGAGVADGYLNDREKTENAFIRHPLFGYIYKTGDYGMLSPEGYIVFMGRKDHQVKIRGYRIELGEIESRLTGIMGITSAVVVDNTNCSGKKYLCAYYVSKEELQAAELRDHLMKYLPEYMVPAYFILIDAIPLTPNGKVDRKKLPEPDINLAAEAEYTEPGTEVEAILVEIWKSVLGIDKVGINSDFYELGGDSIKAIQIASRLQKENYRVDMHTLLQYQTIAEISEFVEKVSTEASQELVEGEVKLTPAQSWFFDKGFTNQKHWNQSVTLFNRDGFDKDTIINVFNKLVEHHDALRIKFSFENGKVIQQNRGLEGKFFDLTVYNLPDGNSIHKMAEEAFKLQEGLDLTNGPLFRLALFKAEEGDKLFITMHHLLIDGISWRILFEDFAIAYIQLLNKQEIQLQKKTNSYKEWADALKQYSNSEELMQEALYWKSVEDTCINALPKDSDIEASLKKDYTEVSVSLTENETQALLKEVNHAYNTEINDILLTALGLTIKNWTGEDSVLINLEAHGRENIDGNIDITRTVGWFTAMYPVILDMNSTEDISYCIRKVKEDLKKIPDKGIGYGVLKYLTDADKKQDMKFKLNPEISFNYLGQFDQDINTEAFTVINELMGLTASPESQNPYTFMIIAMMAESKLKVTFNYNRLQYKEETVVKLAESYGNSLKRIIEHCLGKSDTEFTPSDYGDDNLSIEDLESILNFTDSI